MREQEIIQLFLSEQAKKLTITGDDAAVLYKHTDESAGSPSSIAQIISTDTAIAGVHLHQSMSPYAMGWRAFTAAASDIAAMGAAPQWSTLNLSLPVEFHTESAITELAGGINAAAMRYHLPIIGGDVVRGSGPLQITVTVCGETQYPVLRSGAKVGDYIVVTGRIGGGASGLQEYAKPLATQCPEIRSWYDAPLAQIELAQRIAPYMHAMIDISDGLYVDLERLCAASQCGAAIALEKIPFVFATSATHNAKPSSHNLVPDAGMTHAMITGLVASDDYQLCGTIAPVNYDQITLCGENLIVIGTITAGDGVHILDEAKWQLDSDWREQQWRHF